MTRLAHISDLHFGRTDTRVVDALLADLTAQRPCLVVVSGDLTQRARRDQFEAAKAFLDALPAPYMVVPGNHDLPVFNLVKRFTDPLTAYRTHIAHDLNPFRVMDGVAVLGLNTARSLIADFAEGRVNTAQMRLIRERLGGCDADTFKVVFTHHPFLPPPAAPRTRLVGRAGRALEALEAAGVDLLLAGHLHRAYTGDVMTHHAHVRRSILVAQASTATSTRLRNEPNAWNLIDIDPPHLTIRLRSWEGARFMPGLETRWRKDGIHWHKLAEDTGLAELDRRLESTRADDGTAVQV